LFFCFLVSACSTFNDVKSSTPVPFAQIAKDFLVSQGISEDRLVTISYGKEAPACFEQTEECRLKNHRARFVVFT